MLPLALCTTSTHGLLSILLKFTPLKGKSFLTSWQECHILENPSVILQQITFNKTA
jgi:hypothetical protein